MCNLNDFKHLEIADGGTSSTHWSEFLERELKEWHRNYLRQSAVDSNGKIHIVTGRVSGTVFDFGAGCGETAQFFLNHGAKRVICIEPNPIALELLQANFSRDARVQVIPYASSLVKMDIEGAEWSTVFESHYAAPKLRTLQRWTTESNTGIYSLQPSVYRTVKEDYGNLIHRGLVYQGAMRRRVLGR